MGLQFTFRKTLQEYAKHFVKMLCTGMSFTSIARHEKGKAIPDNEQYQNIWIKNMRASKVPLDVLRGLICSYDFKGSPLLDTSSPITTFF